MDIVIVDDYDEMSKRAAAIIAATSTRVPLP